MSAKEWDRSTRLLQLAQIPPELSAAIQDHLQANNLGPIIEEYQICIQTDSTKKKLGLMERMIGGSKHRTEVAILTPRWLVIASRGEAPGSVGVLSVLLENATLLDHKEHPAYRQMPDSGVHVTGIFTGRVGSQGEQQISCYLGLGEDPAGNEFKEYLRQAIQRTRR